MAEPEISISIEPTLKVSLDENWLQKIATETLKTEGITSSVEIGLVVTDSKTIQKLNKTYRGYDKSTDVLAFHMTPTTNQKPEQLFISPPDGIYHLGEVVISYPQAVKQAQQQSHSIERELALLIVHGVLHLLGYDHELARDSRKMRAKENEILEKLELD